MIDIRCSSTEILEQRRTVEGDGRPTDKLSHKHPRHHQSLLSKGRLVGGQ